MKYIIIGLGNYGHMLAEELSVLGHEVIGADVSASRVVSKKRLLRLLCWMQQMNRHLPLSP